MASEPDETTEKRSRKDRRRGADRRRRDTPVPFSDRRSGTDQRSEADRRAYEGGNNEQA